MKIYIDLLSYQHGDPGRIPDTPGLVERRFVLYKILNYKIYLKQKKF